MSQERIDRASQGGVVTLTLSNPPEHTLTAESVRLLHAELDAVESDAAVRVVVLTGGGDGVFVAHYEVGELADSAESTQGPGAEAAAEPAQLHPLHRLCLRLERMNAITVAALNGHAAGGGFELALACDFRLAKEGPFQFGLPETSVGIIPGAGGTQRVSRLVGTAAALDLILHAQLLLPNEALDRGLVHRVLHPEDFRNGVRNFVDDLAQRAPVALAAAKRAIHAGAALGMEDALAVEQQQFARAMRSEDAAGAMRAWLSGEKWEWKGR